MEAVPASNAIHRKSFLFFFSKKNCLPLSYLLANNRAARFRTIIWYDMFRSGVWEW